MLHGVITQGTTPEQYFQLPFPTSLLTKVSITYTQKEETILVKKLDDCILQENYIIVSLNQEDTLLFKPNQFAIVQIKLKTVDGEVMVSDNYRIFVREVHDKEVF